MKDPFSPPGFTKAKSAVPGIEVFAPSVKEVEERPIVDFDCPQCGAATAYSVADGGLTCTHCGYYEPPQQPVVGKGAEEFEFKVETMQRAAHGWGMARKDMECQNCGARTSLPEDQLTYTCAFCGSNKVIQRQSPQDELRPRFLIPFQIEAQDCRRRILEWLGSSWMVPSALRRLAAFREMAAIYLPFWTFDATANAEWKAEVGHVRTERYYANGEWKTRTVVDWRWEAGRVAKTFDDLLMKGTQRVSEVLFRRVGSYALRQLTEYEPQYLAGLQAQSYDVPLETAWAEAREQMRESTRRDCRAQASTPRIRNFSMNLAFSDETWRYVLLPAYLASYTYNGKTYQVMANGQSGALAGQRPVDWGKLTLVAGGSLTPGVLLLLASLLFPAAAPLLGLLGFGALGVAVIVSIVLLVQAGRMDDV
jgi:ribosomal protein L37AE/L43A